MSILRSAVPSPTRPIRQPSASPGGSPKTPAASSPSPPPPTSPATNRPTLKTSPRRPRHPQKPHRHLLRPRKGKSDALEDTAARDHAYESLRTYMKELKGTAKGALRSHHDLLAKLGLQTKRTNPEPPSPGPPAMARRDFCFITKPSPVSPLDPIIICKTHRIMLRSYYITFNQFTNYTI